MKNFYSQKGFASLEIIFVTAIISLLAAVAVPNLARLLDKILLDYEAKRLCSELDFARSASRTSFFSPEIFEKHFRLDRHDTVTVYIDYHKGMYEVHMDDILLREPHKLSGGIKFQPVFDSPNNIRFNEKNLYSNGSGTIYMVSRYEEMVEIRFDSVGRWRAYRDAE